MQKKAEAGTGDPLPSIPGQRIGDPVPGRRIWAMPMPFNPNSKVPCPGKLRIEFPDLIRYENHWYCAFREAQIHENHWSARGRIIRSADGETWETVKVLHWAAGDAGAPTFSITAEGHLMVNSLIHFVSREPREGGYYYQLDNDKLGLGHTPRNQEERDVASQSVTWVSCDGVNWGSAFACPSGRNTQRYRVTWHNGMGYSLANCLGPHLNGTLYRTRDGKSWQALCQGFVPNGYLDEADLAFGPDGTAYCLIRGSTQTIAAIGIGKGPYYQDWQWKRPLVDWEGNGQTRPIEQVLRPVHWGGPRIICLADGRLLALGRVLPPARPGGPWRIDAGDPEGREDGRVVLFWLNPATTTLTRFAEMDGSSYPGIVEHAGTLRVTFIGGDLSGVFMATLPLEETV